ncbi:DNA-binding transcriptional regulator, PucR family [Haloechinothrix alba]|uniref:DNA-binding transcriptional regulator, PucR family n=1 Tax=Haloechinothrix alba TaxID=664784 RepID=A0A238VTX8_9PSEU|nr:helix-turn-helix domain-containing protein [Haloechinothrix alba]SNR37253.1 DNA-binding transcriptional regulator, PucR family [Haloechinothrix alba]
MQQAHRDRHAEAQAWVREYASGMLTDQTVDALVTRLNDQLTGELPELAADAGVRRDLDASTRDAVRTYLDMMSRGSRDVTEVPAGALGLARTLAQRRYDAGMLLRVYRVGQRVFWAEVMRIVWTELSDADLRMAVLELLWDRLSRGLEYNIDALVAAHAEEAERRLRGSLARKVETVHEILRGDHVDIDTASTRLGHNLRRHQTGLVLWATDAVVDPDPSGRLESLAGAVADALGVARPLTVQSSARVVWAWLASGPSPDLERIRDEATARREPHLRIAVGVPAPGVAGFRDSHREAVRAQSVMVRSESDESMVLYRDVEIVSCLSENTAAMRALVGRELAGLAGRDRGSARLRATVHAYLASGASARAAAGMLDVHKNTVLYRLRQAENLLGYPVDERGLALRLALLVEATYGQACLPEGEG